VISTPGGVIVRVRTFVAVCEGTFESVTWNVSVELDTPVGVPLMTPVAGFSNKGDGSGPPAMIDQV